MSEPPLIDPGTVARARAIDDLLPQTQCRQCGYDGCRPYAEAIVAGQADINQCPPGGAVVIQDLAQLLGREPRPLDESYGVEKARELAVIDEAVCIGCKKCILVCPVDAILGAAKLMHTVIASECTGCNLCPPACPVDCIAMIPAATGIDASQTQEAARETDRQRAMLARRRFDNRNARLAQQSAERAARLAEKKRRAALAADEADRRRVIAEVMQRVSARERQADDGKQ